eukprot:2795432-Pyramimonas_sp.AAC.1
MRGGGLEGCEIVEGKVRQVPAGGADELRRWKAELRGPSSRHVVDMNEKQREVVEKVIGRMIAECQEDERAIGSSEPL